MPGGFCGFDKAGCPVLVELYGHMDMRGILQSTKKSDIEKTKLQLGEQVVEILRQQNRKNNDPVSICGYKVGKQILQQAFSSNKL